MVKRATLLDVLCCFDWITPVQAGAAELLGQRELVYDVPLGKSGRDLVRLLKRTGQNPHASMVVDGQLYVKVDDPDTAERLLRAVVG